MATAPSTPLRLPPRNRGFRSTLLTILGIGMFGFMLVAAGIWTLPALVSDWQVRGQAQPVPNGTITSGKCDSQLIFHICNATLSLATRAGPVSRDVNFVFTDIHFGDYTAGVVADPARPELATTDFALDHLWNRTITLLIGTVILLTFILLPIVALFRRLTGRVPAPQA